MINDIGWYASIGTISFVLFLIWWFKGLTTKREIRPEEEFSGVIEFEQNADDNNSDDDANGLRSKFNGESG